MTWADASGGRGPFLVFYFMPMAEVLMLLECSPCAPPTWGLWVLGPAGLSPSPEPT